MNTQLAPIHTPETVLADHEPDYLGTVKGAFKRHTVAAILVFVTLTALTIAALALITPRYSATTTVMIEARSPQVVNIDSVVPTALSDQNAVSSEIQVLLSRELASAVVRELDLVHDPEFDANRLGWLRSPAMQVVQLVEQVLPDYVLPESVRAWLHAKIERPLLSGPAYENAVVDIVRRDLSVSPIGRSRAISITFSSASPVTAQAVVNILARNYIDHQELLKQSTTELANRRITERLSSLQKAAADAAQRTADFRAEANLTEGRDSSLIRQQISETSTGLTAATSDRIASEARLHEIERAAKNPTKESSAQVLGSRVIQELVIHEAKLTGELAPLNQSLGESNPRLEAARSQVENVRRRIEVEARRIAAGVRGEYMTAIERESKLTAQLEALKKEMANVQRNEVHLGQLEQNSEAARNIYEVFLRRAKETAADGLVEIADARIISNATTPLRPYSPNVRIALPVGVIVALAMALMTAVVAEARDRGIRTQSEAARATGIPTLGTIPKFGRDSEVDPYSMIGAAVSDVYMHVATGRTGKCVVVASALPREGKTTMALCLARMAGRSGKRALLIDCDLRRSDLRERLSLPDGPGISDVLSGEAEIDDVMVRDSVVGEIGIVRCGRPVDNPAALLSSRSMQELLADLRRQFDLIVIDTAPVMAAPETRSLACAADETLLFVKWSTTPRATAVAACRKLRNLGANVVGIVLTMVDVNRIAKYSSVDGVSYSKEVRRYYSREGRA